MAYLTIAELTTEDAALEYERWFQDGGSIAHIIERVVGEYQKGFSARPSFVITDAEKEAVLDHVFKLVDLTHWHIERSDVYDFWSHSNANGQDCAAAIEGLLECIPNAPEGGEEAYEEMGWSGPFDMGIEAAAILIAPKGGVA